MATIIARPALKLDGPFTPMLSKYFHCFRPRQNVETLYAVLAFAFTTVVRLCFLAHIRRVGVACLRLVAIVYWSLAVLSELSQSVELFFKVPNCAQQRLKNLIPNRRF